MSIKRRLAIAAAAAVTATLMVGPAALTAPKTGVVFDVICPGLGAFEVTTPPGNASFTPAFAVDTHQVSIPYRVTGTVTVDGQVVEEFDDVKPAPVPADAITCTFTATFTEGGQTATVSGTALVAQRGAPS
jgi:hypothetical protein